MLTRPEPSVLVKMTRLSSPVGEVRSRPVEREVIEPDIRQVAEPMLDLCQDAAGSRPVAEPLRAGGSKTFKSRMVIAASSAMSWPSILTASASGLSRDPWQAGQSSSRLKRLTNRPVLKPVRAALEPAKEALQAQQNRGRGLPR